MPSYSDLAVPITAKDIRRFDAEAKQLVADFQEEGWRGYLSNQGHAIMLAPDGTTTASVSGHSGGPHLAKWARSDLKKWKRAQAKAGKTAETAARNEDIPNGHTNGGSTTSSEQPYPGIERVDDAQKPFRCVDPGCAERPGFHAIGPAILHRQRAHDGLVCKDCGERFPLGQGSAKAYSIHRQEKHGAKPPKKSGRLRPDKDGKYHCEWCGRPFDSPQGRAGHRKSHKGEPMPAKPPVWVQPDDVDEQTERVEPMTTEPEQIKPTATEPEPAMVRAELVDKQEPEPEPEPTSPALDDLDAWIAGQDPGKLLTTVLATIAPPLVGEIERLRTERNGLRERVHELEHEIEEYKAWLSLLPGGVSRR